MADDDYRRGQADERMKALEDRMNRHETFMGRELSEVKKLTNDLVTHMNRSIGASNVTLAIVTVSAGLFSGIATALAEHLFK